MSDDAGSSSSSRGRSASPGWSSTPCTERGPRRSVVRTTEKSVVFRVRTQEKLSSGRPRALNSSKQALRLPQSEDAGGIKDDDVHETLLELHADLERKKQWLRSEEDTFSRGQECLNRLQREHAELLRELEQCKWRRKERVRIQRMLRGPQAETASYDSEGRSSSSDESSDSDHSSHDGHRRRSSSSSSRRRRRSHRDGARKERKKLRRFQSDLSLRFKLLQSECERTDLKVDRMMADLRREYDNSCLFGNSLSF